MSGAPGNTLLEVRGLSKQYHRRKGREQEAFWALESLDFDLREGEALGIIGPNGAGKSTLLQILSEIVQPTAGEIRYRGKYQSILDIGTGFHPDLSGRENIFFKAGLMGMRRRETMQVLDEIVDFSGVGDFLDTPVKHYSSGMFLRLAFSVAFYTPTKLLYLDEVVAVGDADFRVKAGQRIQKMIAEGAAIILVSHNLNEIADLCSSAMYLREGKIRSMGRTVDVLETYTREVSRSGNALTSMHPEIFRLGHLTCQAAGKQPGAPIFTSDAVEISLELEKMEPDSSLELVWHLTDMTGVRLFTDSYGLRAGYQAELREAGPYTIKACIPAKVLNRGFYRLDLTISRNATEFLEHHLEAGTFVLELPPEEKEIPRISRVNSMLRMQLDWHILKDEQI